MLTKKIAVLFSGGGSNLEAILQSLHGKVFGETKIEVALTLTNKANAGGITQNTACKASLSSTLILPRERNLTPRS